jgi:GNAT superfamily N-acetyltransferase
MDKAGAADPQFEMIATRPDAAEAAPLVDALSDRLRSAYGSDGRASFADWCNGDPRFLFAVALEASAPVGCGAIRPLAPGVAEVKRMYSARTRAGIGRAILRHLEAEARRHGFEWLWLETRAANAQAIAFYRANGFRMRENYGAYLGRPECVCMEKSLVPSPAPQARAAAG